MSSSFDQVVENLLTGLGLSGKEARLYRLLLQEGTLKPATLATKSGLKRGLTYNLLYGLEKRGLTARITKDGRTFFRAENPQKLLDLVENKKQETTTLEANLKQIISQLTSQYKLAVGRPTIRLFEGEQGLKEVLTDVYAPDKKEILGCVDVSLPSPEIYDHIIRQLMPQRIKNKIFTRAFDVRSPQAEALQKDDSKQFREIFLIDGKKYPLPAEIDVYNDKIVFSSFTKGDYVGLVVENASLAETLRSIFRLAFDLARKEKKSKASDKLVG